MKWMTKKAPAPSESISLHRAMLGVEFERILALLRLGVDDGRAKLLEVKNVLNPALEPEIFEDVSFLCDRLAEFSAHVTETSRQLAKRTGGKG